MHRYQKGFGAIEIAIVVVVIVILGLLGWKFLENKNQKQMSHEQTTQNEEAERPADRIVWSYDQQNQGWKASSIPPACKDPFSFDTSPVDITQATSVLYPGQARGGDYKAHGGFAFDNNNDTSVKVIMPFEAYLVGGSCYIESGEIQYILDFESDCGIAIRFDHLAVLSDKFAELADRYLPEPKVDDSRGVNIEPTLIKSGEIVATAVGHAKPSLNVGMDFGVYDYRKRNEASQDTAFQRAHGQFSAQTYHGVCWFDMLPGNDAAMAMALPSRDQAMGKISDYCN